MIPRYTPAEIAAVFSDESRLRRWLQVEVLACEAWARLGAIPESALDDIRSTSVDPERVAELEAEQGHDVAAFVSAVQESAGDAGRYIHLGLTSSDIVDTALATQLRDAAEIIDADCAALEAALMEQAQRHRFTVMMGRTHGVHAEPLTLGFKIANLLDEVRRSRRRLQAATEEVSVGKLSGTVGTHALVPPAVEEHVCRGLRLGTAAITTQVVARDRHASFVTALALLAAVLERMATTVRLLQITEVDEAEEPFAVKQKGSSAMPHKRNPVLCERICGLARIVRGYAHTAMEDVALWHERDIAHSSAERVLLPDACAAVSYMLRLSARVVAGLRVKPETMRAHVDHGGGVVFSQRVLTALIRDAGWSREKAYRAVQALAQRARDGEDGFRDLVRRDPDISDALGGETLDRCFDINEYLSGIDETYRRLEIPISKTSDVSAAPPAPTLAVEAGVAGGRA